MSTAFTVDATIQRPAHEVWATLTDWEQAARWMKGIDSLHSTGPLEVGTTLTFRARGKDRTTEITALDPGYSLTLTSTQGGVTAAYTYTLDAIDESSTGATLAADCRTAGILWNAVGPLLRVAVRRSDGGQLDALKELIEGRR